MNKVVVLNRNLINFGIPIGLLFILIFLMKSPFAKGNEMLSLAISADLLLTVPIVYFILIRKSNIPKSTVIPLMIIGLLIGTCFLPKQDQTYLELFKNWVLPIIELSILSIVIFKVNKAIKSYKKLKNSTPDFFDTLKSVCGEILPKKLVPLFASEVAVFYYGFINWQTREFDENEFTYHKKSGTIPVLVVIIFLVILETFIFHILLFNWSNTLAWILTFLSIYSGIQVFGFLRSMYKRPILIEKDKLILRYGIMNETIIDLKDISSIEISSKDIEFNNETRKLSILGDLESHNTIIRLNQKNTLIGIYGIRRTYKNLALHVDQNIEFENRINKVLQKRQS